MALIINALTPTYFNLLFSFVKYYNDSQSHDKLIYYSNSIKSNLFNIYLQLFLHIFTSLAI